MPRFMHGERVITDVGVIYQYSMSPSFFSVTCYAFEPDLVDDP